MKKNLILALLALFFTLGTGKMTVSAQSGVLQQRISVSVEGGTLDDAVVQIEKQTSLMFLYKTQDIAPSHRVTLHARREPLSVVLDRLVEGTKLGWELSDNHIVLTLKSVDDQPRRVTGHVLDKNGVPIIGATVIVKGTTVGTSTGADGSGDSRSRREGGAVVRLPGIRRHGNSGREPYGNGGHAARIRA